MSENESELNGLKGKYLCEKRASLPFQVNLKTAEQIMASGIGSLAYVDLCREIKQCNGCGTRCGKAGLKSWILKRSEKMLPREEEEY